MYTVSEDGNRHEKFGVSEISDGTTIVPTFGIAHVTIPIEMRKFLGLFVVCVKYYNETNHSYRQAFSFRRGAPMNDHVLTRLDELPSKPNACKHMK